MVSVLQVYTALKDLANKEQKGFITPQVFNSFAALAQMNVYNEIFSELVDAKRISRQNFDPGRDKSVRKQRTEDLSFFFRRNEQPVTNGIAPKPNDLSKIITVSISSSAYSRPLGGAAEGVTNCELVYEPEKMEYILGNNLSLPTEDFPVALVSAVDIEVFPSEITSITLQYYAKPTSFAPDGTITLQAPFYGYDVLNLEGSPVDVFNPTISRDFMLPPHYLTEITMEMAKLIGVNLRDANVLGFGTNEEASE